MFEDKNIKTQDFKSLISQTNNLSYSGPIEETGITETKSLKSTPWWQWLLLALIILAIIVLVWWYFHKPSVKAVLDPVSQVSENQDLSAADTVQEDASVDAGLDTDQDGLTDMLETVVWFTDPQIADTDADGYSDGEEINNGYNPLGAGKLGENVLDTAKSEPESVLIAQGVLDNFAKSINEKNSQNFLQLVAPANTIYAQAQADPMKFLTFFVSYYQEQVVSFSIKSANQSENKINANADTLLDNNFFENTSFVLENINNEWKILE